MSQQKHSPFHLRQNKSVDRELFLDLLLQLKSCLDIARYRYIGMGGAFLEDFRLVHARLGIMDMVCVEFDKNVQKRQQFNRPVSCIAFEEKYIEEYINITEFSSPVILWLDYTESKKLREKFSMFSQSSMDLPINSVLRITLNASGNAFGKNLDDQESEDVDPGEAMERRNTLRLTRFQSELGDIVPIDLKPSDMNRRNFGISLLKTLRNAIDGKMSRTDRRAVWALATHYADGQPMVTATVVVCEKKNESVDRVVSSWEHMSGPESPLVLDMPVLSTLERLTLQSCEDPKDELEFELPDSDMGRDPFISFKKYYRFFPHFSRVEL